MKCLLPDEPRLDETRNFIFNSSSENLTRGSILQVTSNLVTKFWTRRGKGKRQHVKVSRFIIQSSRFRWLVKRQLQSQCKVSQRNREASFKSSEKEMMPTQMLERVRFKTIVFDLQRLIDD